MRFAVLLTVLFNCQSIIADGFRVLPYLQNPAPDAITIRWLSNSSASGQVTVTGETESLDFMSKPFEATTLAFNPFKEESNGPHPESPWMHSVRVSELQPGNLYRYSVHQGTESHSAEFRTAPATDKEVRFIVYADSETEPESATAAPVDWPSSTGSNRPEGITKYLTDQTSGYSANCRLMLERNPDLVLLVGDIVESGGEQRDWDEFWRHNAGEWGALASRIPIVASLGNHENYGGPGGGYTAEGANFGTDKFLTYFEVPENGAANPKHKGRYFRMDYGPVTVISVDSSDGLPHKTASDTNHNLEGSNAPDFNPGSEQFRWLEVQLADARNSSRFTFVQFHHTMFGSGPHSVPFGHENFSGQSGIAMRALLPVLMKYGVDVVFSGHDEMLERSLVEGDEMLSDGSTRDHAIHFYDVGIGGDGLRGPSVDFDNPYRKFLAHEDFPEVWEGTRLVSGGKHYGHVEVNVLPDSAGNWQVHLAPVHVFPVLDSSGTVASWERRLYPDEVTITQPQ